MEREGESKEREEGGLEGGLEGGWVKSLSQG